MGRGSYNGGSTIIRGGGYGGSTEQRTPAKVFKHKAAKRRKPSEVVAPSVSKAALRAKAKRKAAKRAQAKPTAEAIAEREQRERAKAAAANVTVEHRRRRIVKVSTPI